MGRRFPTPIVGVENARDWAPKLVRIVEKAGWELPKEEFLDRCQDNLRKEDGSEYSREYIKRTISTYIRLGVIREQEDRIKVWQFAKDYRAGDIDYSKFLWFGIKQNWVLRSQFPEGIEGLRDLHDVVRKSDSPLDAEGIREALTERFGYEYDKNGIRGYPELLSQLKAIRKVEEGYEPGPKSGTFKDRWRDVDVFHRMERWFYHRGPNFTPPRDTIKRDLAKYYIYRECGGFGRHRSLYKRAIEEYIGETSRSSDVSHPQLHMSEEYNDAEKEREELRDKIKSKFDDITGRDLSGLYADTLNEILESDSEQKAKDIISEASSGISRRDLINKFDEDRDTYTFPEEFSLYDWQNEAVEEWFEKHNSEPQRGIAEVVTGAGKTVMAIEVVRRWLERNPDGIVTVVVPTKVLMNQWLEEFIDKLNANPEDIGWAGGGNKDVHSERKIIVSIVNSAVQEDHLEKSIRESGSEEHLLIADECHRYTGEKHSNFLDYPHSASLGLSATPLSKINPNEDELTEDDEMLLDKLGSMFYRLGYEEALGRGLVSEFTIKYIGFDLTQMEKHTYDRFSDKVSSAVSDIERRYGNRLYELNGPYPQKLKTIRDSSDSACPAISDFFEFTSRRRDLIDEALTRQAITHDVLEEAIEEEKKAIVFQEKINQLEKMVAAYDKRKEETQTGKFGSEDEEKADLYNAYQEERDEVNKKLEELFFKSGYKPVMYHSDHRTERWNDWSIEWFGEDGFANVMLSVKALKEGVDVPSADVGLIRVSSGSIRDRIQTLGRILRTGHDPDTPSTLYVLYARDTVDEKIFSEVDWEREIGGNHEYYLWETGENEIEGQLAGPDPAYRPDPQEYTEPEVPDESELEVGDKYEGPRRGMEISVNADGRPFEDNSGERMYILNPEVEELAEVMEEHRSGRGGRMIINEAGHAITITSEGPVFLGVLEIDSRDFDYESELGDGDIGFDEIVGGGE